MHIYSSETQMFWIKEITGETTFRVWYVTKRKQRLLAYKSQHVSSRMHNFEYIWICIESPVMRTKFECTIDRFSGMSAL